MCLHCYYAILLARNNLYRDMSPNWHVDYERQLKFTNPLSKQIHVRVQLSSVETLGTVKLSPGMHMYHLLIS